MLKKAICCLVCLLFVLSGCAGQPNNHPGPAGLPASAQLAPVYQLHVQILGSGVTVTASGELPEACDRIQAGAVSRVANRFTVKLVNSPVPGLTCQPVQTPYTQEIPLDVTGLPNGVYLVAVNALETTFELQNQPIVQASFTPTPASPASRLSSATATLSPSSSPTAVQAAAPTLVQTSSPTPAPLPTGTSTKTVTPPLPPSPTSPATPVPTLQPTPTRAKPAGPAPTPTAVATSNPLPDQPAVTPPPSDCINKAAFDADVTIPDGAFFRQGTPFTKTWRIRNVGTCAWDSSYTLIFVKGSQLGGPLSQPLPAVKPGEAADISIDLAAPNQGGTYWGIYAFQDPQGRLFGVNSAGLDLIWVKINVSWFNPTPDPALSLGRGRGDGRFQAIKKAPNPQATAAP